MNKLQIINMNIVNILALISINNIDTQISQPTSKMRVYRFDIHEEGCTYVLQGLDMS